MGRKLLSVFIGIMVMSLFFIGCAGNKTVEQSKEGKYRVVTSFYPMYITALNVTKGIEGVEVINMTKPQTGCLHDYQLTPEDVKTLDKADVFIINGAGMESFMEKVINGRKNLHIIDASRGIELLKDSSGEENPHVWVSVSDAIEQVNNIASQLAQLDGKHAEQYKENAKTYIDKLEQLKREMHDEIDSSENKNIVTFHEAFPYFAKEFNLNIVSVIEREPGTEPSPKELETTIKQIKDLHIKALFAEPQYPAGSADTIAKETGTKVYTLDPVVSGEANSNAADDYINIMKNNAKVLKEALN